VVAQSVDPFAPDAGAVERARLTALADAVPKPLHVQVETDRLSADKLADLRHLLSTFPGKSDVVLELSADRRVRLGVEYRVEPNAGLRAELEHLLGGPARLVA
jgi:hypothetical protein